MSWMSLLYQTYENNKEVAGKGGGKVTLSVVAHMPATAQIEITIDQTGNFLGASEIKKEDGRILIPVTEKSAGRSNGIAPHALCDTLSYVAGDFEEYAATEKEVQKSREKFSEYKTELGKWVHSDYTHNKIKAIYSYITKKSMIQDLINCGLVNLNEEQKLSARKISGQPYEKAIVRFIVISGESEDTSRTWEDSTLMEAYTNYYLSIIPGKKEMCYLTGSISTIATNHPKGIVASSYGAKLISAQDTANFVYRGRFIEAEEACTVSYDATQKAHSALTWLVAQQGVTVGSQDKRTYVCWNPKGKPIPIMDELFSDLEDQDEAMIYTEPEYRKRLQEALKGYAEKLNNNDDIIIMGLDAATTGRLSITYFNELKASDYLERLKKWADTCHWFFTSFTLDKKPVDKLKTPTIKQIVTCSFGTEQGNFIEVNDKVLKEQTQRLYYCMLDGQPLPKDIIHAIFRKASTPLAYTYGNHERVLCTACALIAKYYNDKKEGTIAMILDEKNTDRSYLFGRLLAVAEKVEKRTYKKDESRTTNAIRLQAAFVNHPMQTWMILENSLNSYFQKLNPQDAEYYRKLIENIVGQLQDGDMGCLNKSLGEMYLIGYYTQRKELRYKEKEENTKEEANL